VERSWEGLFGGTMLGGLNRWKEVRRVLLCGTKLGGFIRWNEVGRV
jgi:hypothetical protein